MKLGKFELDTTTLLLGGAAAFVAVRLLRGQGLPGLGSLTAQAAPPPVTARRTKYKNGTLLDFEQINGVWVLKDAPHVSGGSGAEPVATTEMARQHGKDGKFKEIDHALWDLRPGDQVVARDTMVIRPMSLLHTHAVFRDGEEVL